MSKITLTVACGDYDRTHLLANGKVRPEGLDLVWLDYLPYEIFFRMLRHEEFDASEMSMSNYMTELCREKPRFVAIPVFPSRFFRHSCVFTNVNSGIQKPEDLRGKRFGAPEYSMTALLWIRAMLKHEYGVDPSEMEWFIGGVNAPSMIERRDRVDIDLPGELSITPIPAHETLNSMLLEGKLDAVGAAATPQGFVKGDPRVARLFPDYRQAEEEYFRKTGFFPIMHTFVLRREVYDRYPWAARNLYDAFLEAKNRSLARLSVTNSLVCSAPWIIGEMEKARALMGEDFWPYGIEANRRELTAMMGFAREQFLIDRDLSLEDLFAGETLGT